MRINLVLVVLLLRFELQLFRPTVENVQSLMQKIVPFNHMSDGSKRSRDPLLSSEAYYLVDDKDSIKMSMGFKKKGQPLFSPGAGPVRNALLRLTNAESRASRRTIADRIDHHFVWLELLDIYRSWSDFWVKSAYLTV